MQFEESKAETKQILVHAMPHLLAHIKQQGGGGRGMEGRGRGGEAREGDAEGEKGSVAVQICCVTIDCNWSSVHTPTTHMELCAVVL